MPSVSVSGMEVFFREQGDGAPVLLGHSSAAGSGQWRALIDRLSTRYHVLAPDHIGYGKTASYHGDAPLMTMEIRLLESLLHRAAAPAHLVGHSYGGSLMTRLAMRHPERVRSLTLIEPTLFHLLAMFDRSDAHAEIAAVAERLIDDVAVGEPERAARDFITYWVGPGALDAMEQRQRHAVIASMPKVAAEFPAAFEPEGATPSPASALGFSAAARSRPRTSSTSRTSAAA